MAGVFFLPPAKNFFKKFSGKTNSPVMRFRPRLMSRPLQAGPVFLTDEILLKNCELMVVINIKKGTVWQIL